MSEPSDLFRLRLFKGCLKNKVRPDAGDLLNRILEIEDATLRTDILRSLVADSLNRFCQSDAPFFSHFMIQNALGDEPVKGVEACAPIAKEVQCEGSRPSEGRNKGQSGAASRSQVVESKDPQKPLEPRSVEPDADGDASGGFDIDPRFKHLIG